MALKINDLSLQKKIGFTPHPAQQEVLDSFKIKRDIVLSSGRRWGKSVLCAYFVLRTALADNQEIAIVSASYSLTERIFDYLNVWVRQAFPSATISQKPFPQIIFPSWNSKIIGLSTEAPEGILGRGLDLCVIDEASRVPKKVFEQYIYPTLTSKQGKLVLISTPLGKENYFFQKFQEIKQSPDGAVFTFPTSTNPHFSKEEWKRTKAKLPKDIFSQEFEAIFSDSGATVFKTDDIRACVGEPLKEPQYGHRYAMGLDLAKINDFSVITVADIETHEIVYWERLQKLSYSLQRQKITSIAEKYNHAQIVIEINNIGASMSDELRATGCRVEEFKTVGSISPDWSKRGSKEKLIEHLSTLIQEKAIVIPPEEVLIDELESFGISISPSGNTRYSAPEGGHDDTVMSLALACWNLKGGIQTLKDRVYKEEYAKETRITRSQPRYKTYQ